MPAIVDRTTLTARIIETGTHSFGPRTVTAKHATLHILTSLHAGIEQRRP